MNSFVLNSEEFIASINYAFFNLLKLSYNTRVLNSKVNHSDYKKKLSYCLDSISNIKTEKHFYLSEINDKNLIDGNKELEGIIGGKSLVEIYNKYIELSDYIYINFRFNEYFSLKINEVNCFKFSKFKDDSVELLSNIDDENILNSIKKSL
ncbi:hypothetical protein [Xenorhabdus thailandensis]|uniref:hypothetical protein n=1 Tax=Xenorhabdus thailandensis TaxID=3136255 RepID=UPI0030F4A4D1